MSARKSKKETTPVIDALKFISLAQKDTGAPHQTHCRIFTYGGRCLAVAYDGILAAGTPFPEELPDICPHTAKLLHALERAKGTVATTVQENTVVVKTNKFRAVVPSLAPIDLYPIAPDNPDYPLNDDFRAALVNASALTKEGAQTVLQASVITRNGSIVGTNGAVLIEAWHGIATPPGLIIPKAFITALQKCGKSIRQFGFSDTTFTVWFEDESWLKTQLYSERWPNYERFLVIMDNATPHDVPKDFWDGVNNVVPFSEDGYLYFNDGKIYSSKHVEAATSYVCKEGPAEIRMRGDYLKVIEKFVQKINFDHDDRMTIFFGENIRGAIVKST